MSTLFLKCRWPGCKSFFENKTHKSRHERKMHAILLPNHRERVRKRKPGHRGQVIPKFLIRPRQRPGGGYYSRGRLPALPTPGTISVVVAGVHKWV